MIVQAYRPGHRGRTGRADGRNLILEAKAAGFVVLRSRGEFEALGTQLKSRPQYAPKVLGLFGRDDFFNDVARGTPDRVGSGQGRHFLERQAWQANSLWYAGGHSGL